MNTLKFKNGDKMPALGLGTWKSEPGKVYEAVKTAIELGYRHIDCAPIYGNEAEIGQAISEAIAEGLVNRNELWITSKLWNDSHAREDVIPALKKTLKDLQIEYLDLFLIHWPVAIRKGVFLASSGNDLVSLEELPLTETWEAMESAVSMGLARHIGVSNFGVKNLSLLLDKSSIKPEMNQVELHPYLQQDNLYQFCKENEILLTAYSPLGSSDRPILMKARNEPSLLQNETIVSIAETKGITPAQVLLSWVLMRDISVIPKSVNPERMAQNLSADNITLTADEMAQISELEKGYRYITGQFWVKKDGPYTLESVWQ